MNTIVTDQHLLHLLQELRAAVIQFDDTLDAMKQRVLLRRIETIAQSALSLKARLSDGKEDGTRRVVDALDRMRMFVKIDAQAIRSKRHTRKVTNALAERYEHLLAAAKASPRWRQLTEKLGTLRPKNYWRNVFHMSMGLLGVTLYEWFFSSRGDTLVALGLVLACYLILDGVRRLHPKLNTLIYGIFFKVIARPRERFETPAATWFVLGLIFAVSISSQTHAQMACLVLGLGDPAASLIGKKWGRSKIYRDRTWLGTLGFVGVTFCAGVIFLVTCRDYGLGLTLTTALLASISGAMAELFSNDRLDDNLLVPCAVAVALTVCL